MICMNMYVDSDVMHMYPVHQRPCSFWLLIWMSTVHAPWLSHCKSSWSCMNWKLSSKHLYVAQAVVSRPARICASKSWSEEPPLRDGRQVNKLSNLLYLTRCGFYDCLEEGELVGPNMGTWGRAHELATATFSNIVPLQQKLKKLLRCI